MQDANLQDILDLSKTSERGGSSTHKQINTPMWKTKSPSISLDFQKQVNHQHKRRSVPKASKTQTRNTPKELSAGAGEGQLNVSRKQQVRITYVVWKQDTNSGILTWHHVTDWDKSSVLQTGKITQQFSVNHTIPVPNRIILQELNTWEPYNPLRHSSSL